MNTFVRETLYQNEPCVELSAGGYYALFAPKIGGLMLRLKNLKDDLEILRFSESFSIDDIKECPLIYGLPTLYLPNRYYQGVLKTSDATYNLPINDTEFGNYIHGFIHLREYTVIEMKVLNDTAIVSAEYVYDENDEFFKTFPVKFRAVLTYTLSKKGLEHKFAITNLSDAVLPVSVAAHTTINCVFSEKSVKEDFSVSMNVVKKVVLDEHSTSTGELAELSEYDLAYKNATMNPLVTEINNDMYLVNPSDTDGNKFYGAKFFDKTTGQTICYESGSEYNYWLYWNGWAKSGYCCTEPMTGLINAPNIPLGYDITGYSELKKGECWTGYQYLYSFKN